MMNKDVWNQTQQRKKDECSKKQNEKCVSLLLDITTDEYPLDSYFFGWVGGGWGEKTEFTHLDKCCKLIKGKCYGKKRRLISSLRLSKKKKKVGQKRDIKRKMKNFI